ncbi:hypothetical protein ACFVY0_49025, partial [Streptomyces sp. NPDC058286]
MSPLCLRGWSGLAQRLEGLQIVAPRACVGGLGEADAADQVAGTLSVAIDRLTLDGQVSQGALEDLIAQQPKIVVMDIVAMYSIFM